MEWYYHILVYPQAFFGVLPSYVWKTIVGMKDFLVEVQNTKKSLVDQMEEEEEENESDCDSETEHKED